MSFFRKWGVELVVVGPDAPLLSGLANDLVNAGIPTFGPSAEADALESSKNFMKSLWEKYNIPTAKYQTFTFPSAAKEYIKEQGAPIVIKADGLAAGKGVIVSIVIVEEFREGEAASFFALVDGENAIPLESAQDHKRVGDGGDTGPNTGGMGAYSPAPVLTEELQSVTSLAKLIEYNVRFGDPECQSEKQVLVLRLESDLVHVPPAACRGELKGVTLDWSLGSAIVVVMAANGYPGSYDKGSVIQNLEEAEQTSCSFCSDISCWNCSRRPWQFHCCWGPFYGLLPREEISKRHGIESVYTHFCKKNRMVPCVIHVGKNFIDYATMASPYFDDCQKLFITPPQASSYVNPLYDEKATAYSESFKSLTERIANFAEESKRLHKEHMKRLEEILKRATQSQQRHATLEATSTSMPPSPSKSVKINTSNSPLTPGRHKPTPVQTCQPSINQGPYDGRQKADAATQKPTLWPALVHKSDKVSTSSTSTSFEINEHVSSALLKKCSRQPCFLNGRSPSKFNYGQWLKVKYPFKVISLKRGVISNLGGQPSQIEQQRLQDLIANEVHKALEKEVTRFVPLQPYANSNVQLMPPQQKHVCKPSPPQQLADSLPEATREASSQEANQNLVNAIVSRKTSAKCVPFKSNDSKATKELNVSSKTISLGEFIIELPSSIPNLPFVFTRKQDAASSSKEAIKNKANMFAKENKMRDHKKDVATFIPRRGMLSSVKSMSPKRHSANNMKYLQMHKALDEDTLLAGLFIYEAVVSVSCVYQMIFHAMLKKTTISNFYVLRDIMLPLQWPHGEEC
ncbi:hypothetical protein SLEP1_g40764 [Rubroshorea leprosula]|uniref:ATP-grasp domain-containing protein n=1 Tax=Rubroshorea leprosula TaxID=152421 RepID=A0AAV5L4L5_9ROSI|nr:hypothetical protein SLEP1_g40764 [Rubroshorea leprosula]